MHLIYQVDFFQFMVEMEADWELPFLNVLVNRNNGALSFNVYRKSMHCPVPEHNVVLPNTCERPVVASLLNRYRRICMKPEDLTSYCRKNQKNLSMNSYTPAFMKTVEHHLFTPSQLPVA